MERLKKPRDKKVRVNISIDESVYMEYGLYIDNLSSFLNKTLKNYIEHAKNSLNNNTDSESTHYVKKKKVWNDYNEMKEYMENEKRAQEESQAHQEIMNLLKKGELPF